MSPSKRISPTGVIAFAVRRMWDEYISVLLISAAWLPAQVLIVTGPPATAMLFAMTQKTHDGIYWSAADAWSAFRQLFVPAWKWAIPNLAFAGVALYNLTAFWSLPGGAWAALRLLWFLGLVGWLALNLYFWPFWLAAADKSFRNTYANCARFWLLHPPAALAVFVICLIIGLVSLPFALPIALGAVFLIAMISTTAVRRSLQTLAG